MENETDILKQIWILNKLIFIASFFLSLTVFSQDDDLYDHGLDQDKWQDIREGIRYEGREEGPGREWTYEGREEYERERRKFEGGEGNGGNGNGKGDGWGEGDGANERPRTNENYTPPPAPRFNPPSFGGLGFIGYILLAVFAAGLIFLIFYLFINAEKDGAKIKGEPINFEEVNPTEIPLSELQRLLQEALANQDYRGAIRIYFIFIVRDLAEKKWINWEKEKTNFHYLNEMQGKKGYEDFNISVSYFEIIWYGKREIDVEKFEKVRPKFTAFLDKLGVK